VVGGAAVVALLALPAVAMAARPAAPAGKPAAARKARLERAREARLRKLQAAQLRSQIRAQVRSIDRFCDRLAEITQDTEHRRLFAFSQPVASQPGSWTEHRDARRLEWLLRAGRASEVAEVWTRDDGATAITVTLRGAGDWAGYIEYCFRGNGTLARTRAPTRAVLTEDADDGRSRNRKRFFAATGAPLAPPPVRVAGRKAPLRAPVARKDDPRYRAVSDLPFAMLLRPEAPLVR
jgi:hypothetical protein